MTAVIVEDNSVVTVSTDVAESEVMERMVTVEDESKPLTVVVLTASDEDKSAVIKDSEIRSDVAVGALVPVTVSIDLADSELVVKVTAAVDESKPLVAVSINEADSELI